jgi:ATP-binding cassette subfamily B multidrug efflux pump
MRLVSLFEIVNHTLVVGLIHGCGRRRPCGCGAGPVGTGAVAAATAMALRHQRHVALGDVGDDLAV